MATVRFLKMKSAKYLRVVTVKSVMKNLMKFGIQLTSTTMEESISLSLNIFVVHEFLAAAMDKEELLVNEKL